jgi:cysteinyl-tRNA synthetase
MSLQLYNTLSRSLEPFVPQDPQGRNVLVYSCGPTVYSYAHIGNFRSFLLADLLRRVLVRRGFSVRHVMNITDVGHMTQDHLADASGEDKLTKAARELGWDPFVVARHFESAFARDAKVLGLANYVGAEAEDAQLHPRATRFVPEMLVLIQRLIERGYAYTDGAGQVYFEIAKFPEYGQLSGKQLDELDAGARVDVRAEKRDPRDFALWKVDDKHLMQWDPQSGEGFEPADWQRLQSLLPEGVHKGVGRGFPGWHIECSAMAKACLGELIDIHTGGEDNVFPHHECEIAQSCAANGSAVPGLGDKRSFARYWVHSRHLLVNNRKMSKSDGTFYTVRDLLDPKQSGRAELAAELETAGFAGGKVAAQVIRLALMSTSYQLPMNFTFDTLVQARAIVARIQTRYERLTELVLDTKLLLSEQGLGETEAQIARCNQAFDAALDDNLDYPRAVAAVGAFVSELNRLELGGKAALRAREVLEQLDLVLGVLSHEVKAGSLTFAELDKWSDPEFVKARGAALACEGDDARALLDGSVPGLAVLEAATELDAPRVELWLAARYLAKRGKQFPVADRIRQRLGELGVVIEDAATGVRWRIGSV